MRVYSEQKELIEVVCNRCGHKLLTENGIVKEECIHVEHDFGFFGTKDGFSHQFDLCEDCYEDIIGSFAVPVTEKERTELL